MNNSLDKKLDEIIERQDRIEATLKKISNKILYVDAPQVDYEVVKAAVIEENNASNTFVQRKFKIGYSQAVAILDRMESEGIIGSARGTQSKLGRK